MWANGGLWSFLKLTILKWYNYQSPHLTPDSEYTPLTTMLYLFLIHWVFGVIIQTPLDQCWTMRFHKSSFHSSDTRWEEPAPVDYMITQLNLRRWAAEIRGFSQRQCGCVPLHYIGASDSSQIFVPALTTNYLCLICLQIPTSVWKEPIWLALYMLSLCSNNAFWMNVWITQSIKWLPKGLQWYKCKIE